MNIHQEKERLRWACRRGKLELDLFLIAFLEDCYEALTQEEKETFRLFLSETDPELHAYLMLEKECEHASYRALVQKIRTHRTLVNRNLTL